MSKKKNESEATGHKNDKLSAFVEYLKRENPIWLKSVDYNPETITRHYAEKFGVEVLKSDYDDFDNAVADFESEAK